MEAEYARERPQQGCLTQTGDTFQQDMAPREQADNDAIDDILLADYDLGDFCADTVEFSDRLCDISFTKHLFILRQDEDSGGRIVTKRG